ncbi:ATP-binding cassette domain-containing protein [Cohnella sp.]|uniref:ATP-binding cassette domain-containing protein n=1 Tax=Cohnella sp. TaxID=1883426 RepID=UPI00356130AD
MDGIRWRRGEEGSEAFRTEGLVFTPGSIILLMGANGAGKSTLLEKIAGLRPPEDVLAAYGPDAVWRRSRLGRGGHRLNGQALLGYSYASQAPEEGLFARSVSDELAYSLRPYGLTEEAAALRRQEALSAVGWKGEEWLERDPYLMSGGERRRTALAAVFAAPAPWLLLDEPTAGLDGAGHRMIALKLREMRSEGMGIVLVSHDSDWALPLADETMLLAADGTVRLCSREQLVRHPEWLVDTGMRVPEWLQAAHRLWRSGVPAELTMDPTAAAAAWKVEQRSENAARVLVGALGDGGNEEKQAELDRQAGEAQEVDGERKTAEVGQAREQLGADEGREFAREWQAGEKQEIGGERKAGKERKRHRQLGATRHRLAGFDPRSVWLAYALVSFGLFALRDWPRLAVGAAIVIGLLFAGRISLRRWRGLIVNYAVFSVMTSAIFASGAGSEWAMRGEAFADTLLTFTRTMLILLLGLAIPLVMSPLSLRRSLEQMTSIKGKSPMWAQRGILAVALIMRFVPVLLELWERFSKIIRARGKTLARGPIAFGRKLRDTALPFMLALFRLGDEVVLALESRGVGGIRTATRAQRLRWRGRDYALAYSALLLALGLWIAS